MWCFGLSFGLSQSAQCFYDDPGLMVVGRLPGIRLFDVLCKPIFTVLKTHSSNGSTKDAHIFVTSPTAALPKGRILFFLVRFIVAKTLQRATEAA